MMNLDDFSTYTNFTRETADYIVVAEDVARTDPADIAYILNILYVANGLAGEAGEFANTAKKIIRNDKLQFTAERRDQLIDELGDVFWYSAQAMVLLTVGITQVLFRNIAKLTARKAKGMISKDGADR